MTNAQHETTRAQQGVAPQSATRFRVGFRLAATTLNLSRSRAPGSGCVDFDVVQKMDEPSSTEQQKRAGLGWFLSASTGTLIAWLSSAAVLPIVFGIARRDSSSLWMLSGVADLVMGFLCIPAFLLAHGLSYAALKNADTTQWRAFRSFVQGILFFWIVLVIAWGDNGPVLRGN